MLFSSCWNPTQQEIEDTKKICDINGERVYINDFGSPICISKQSEFWVEDCIRKYVDSIDEKYNNPDTVSNLREDNYSQVVKTCNETFGSLSGSVKK